MIWIYIAPPMAFAAGIVLGGLLERIEWNRLIKDGVISAPKE